MAELPSPLSRSPSPAAPNPVPVQITPGPRASNFIRTYNDALKRILGDCSYDNFAHCFPTPAKYNPEALKTLHQRFVDRLGERCHEEFNVIMQERNVIVALNELDRLVNDARQRRVEAHRHANGGPVQVPIPPHSLPPAELFNAQIGPRLMADEKRLETRLEEMRPANLELSARIQKQRHEIDAILGRMQAGVEDLDTALAMVSHDDLTELTREAVAVDTALTAV